MTVVNNGRRYLVNVADDEGVGPGFSVGQLVMRGYADNQWHLVTASGSAGSNTTFVNQTPLSYITGSDKTSYYDQNFPYQLVASTDGNAYAVYLNGNGPVALTISQSAYGKAYITNSRGAIIDMAKPSLYLQSITDGSFYNFHLSSSGGTTTLISASSGVLSAPPAPTLLNDGSGDLIQTTNGIGDSGGTIILYQGSSPTGPWSVDTTDVFVSIHSWYFDESVIPSGTYWYCTETGNGINYKAVESSPSNIVIYGTG